MSLIPLGFWKSKQGIVTNGLVLHLDTNNTASYPGSGTTWTDLSGNGNNCTLFGSPTFTSNLGGQLIFDGQGTKYGVIQDSSTLKPSNQITISMVLSSNHTGNDARSALMRGFFGDGYGMLHANQYFTFYINSWNSFFNGRAVKIDPLGVFSLRNIVGVYDGTNLKIYENGILIETGVAFSGAIVYPNGFNVEVARSPGSDGNGNQYWNGSISQVLIYNRGLSPTEVSVNYNVLKQIYSIEPKPILHWDAGNATSYPGSGTTIQDLSISDYDGTLNGPAYSSSDSGKFVVVKSENDWINSSGSNTGYAVIGVNNISLECWVRLDNENRRATILGNRNSQQGGELSIYIGTWLSINSSSDSKKISIIGSSFNGVVQRVYSSVNDIFDGTWKHIIVTRTNQYTFKLYINSVEQTITLNYSGGSGTFDISNTYTWRVGDAGSSNGGFSFNGDLSIVRLHNRTLTSSEIQEQFNLEKSRYFAMVVGGTFTSFNGQTNNRIIRLLSNGSKDSSFDTGTGFNDTVIAFGKSVQSDHKIIVGHNFTTYNGISSPRLARLNTDGSYDNTFDVGTGFNSTTPTISLQSDGKVVIGGGFITYKGITASRIIRLNTNGSIDSEFIFGTGFNGTTETLAIDDSQKIIIGGGFTSYNGTSSNRIIRLNINGAVDTSFNIGSGFNNNITRLIIDSSSRVIVIGFFTSYNGISNTRIVRINSNGTRDTSFAIGSGFNNIPRSINQQTDGKLVIGGIFTSYNGTSSNRIIRLNTDGTVDTSFNIGSGFSSGTVWDIAIQPDGKIVVVGDFISYNGTTANRIIRLNSDGSRDTSFNPGTGFNNNTAFWVQFITL